MKASRRTPRTAARAAVAALAVAVLLVGGSASGVATASSRSRPDAAPAKRKVTPAKRKVTPAKRKATPAKKKATPAKKKATPAEPTAAPAKGTAGGVSACGGEALPAKPGGGAWTCSFDDEFDASTGDPSGLNTSWWVPQVTATSAYTTGPVGAQACYVNSPNNISVSGGALHLTVRREAAPFSCAGEFTTQYTAGMVSTYAHFNQTYGRFEVRALLPQTAARGLQETLWLWPVDDTKYGAWPGSGEVDFSEFYSEYESLDIPYIHYDYSPATVNPTTHTNTVTSTSCEILPSQYNDYAVLWSPGSFTITINGSTCLVDDYLADGGLTVPEPFDQPFFIALTQAIGVGTNAFAAGTTPLPATTSIDYVRVWK
jgi:beta-glucanase (GH16 family)